MRKLYIGSILFTVVLSFFTSQSIFPVAEKKPWTFLVYIAAANNLNEFAYLDIQEMMKVGSNEHINVLAFATIQKEGRAKITSRLYVEKGAVRVYEDTPMDSGSRDTLLQAMTWAVTEYPSDHVAVVLWDHGSGPLNRCPSWMRGICYDDETGSFLTDLDCKYVFEKINREFRADKKLDIVACDACLMANIEIAHALQSCADFFVASQETIPGDGYEYSRVLSKFQQGVLSPELFARAMIEAYDKTYTGQSDYTLSLVDLHKLPVLTRALNQVADMLTGYLLKDTSGRLRTIIEKCSSPRLCVHFTEETYIDLYEFARALVKYLNKMPISAAEKSSLGSALIKVQRACNECILDNVQSANLRTARGISIYFPHKYEGIEKSYPLVHWSRTTNWLNFLQAYINNK